MGSFFDIKACRFILCTKRAITTAQIMTVAQMTSMQVMAVGAMVPFLTCVDLVRKERFSSATGLEMLSQ